MAAVSSTTRMETNQRLHTRPQADWEVSAADGPPFVSSDLSFVKGRPNTRWQLRGHPNFVVGSEDALLFLP